MTSYFRPDYTPEWFHLENYEPLKDMNREDISKQLHIRFFYYGLNDFALISFLHIFLGKVTGIEDLKNHLSQKKEQGKYIGVADSFEIEFFSVESSIKPLTYRALEDVIDDLQKSENESAIAFRDYWKGMGEYPDEQEIDSVDRTFAYSKNSDKHPNFSLNDEICCDRENTYSPHIIVDLRHNDDRIIDDMRAWLQEKRRERKERLTDNAIFGNPLSTKLRGLIDNKIIPCMDLLFWAKYKGIRYTNAQLRDMLFPLQGVGEDKVRLQIREEAMKYLTTPAYTDVL